MANRIKGITVEIGGDTTKLSKALDKRTLMRFNIDFFSLMCYNSGVAKA